ncbi:ribonuclease [Diaphorobacter limosus]|jgi:ribonuclease T1|uniref:Ribonuclease n=1 Tax=Diaphorobacter limosus TaxID=3036128 RepID=A0ABZ0J034_9BURK|nr:ribonuclease [Diaphorobacter sp. Y-1]WOO31378.1 ribonuclease [Diaphorobacter sp. Y-1]HRM48445.1 ribonuclease [Alicycliphilus sp.]
MLKAVANRAYKAIVACALGAAVVLAPAGVGARQWQDTPVSSPIALAELPKEGRATYALIHEGGPFPHDKDGSVFGNRERQLPAKKRGYYREYTVRTPGVAHRGARRIVCGGAKRMPDACYYTSDHYTSFREIRQ